MTKPPAVEADFTVKVVAWMLGLMAITGSLTFFGVIGFEIGRFIWGWLFTGFIAAIIANAIAFFRERR